jgi:hypothetical protein
MRVAKKLWLYGGLAVPQGVAFVRRDQVTRSLAHRRVLLLGDGTVRGLAPSMARLAGCSGTALHVDMDIRATARDWARGAKLKGHLSVFRPTSVIFALDPCDMLARRCIRAKLKSVGAEDFWLIPPGVQFPPSSRCVPAVGSDVAGLAAWSAKVWAMIQ